MKDYFVDITAIVRSIQRSEGKKDCFKRGKTSCDDVDCVWRPYCMEVDRILGKTKSGPTYALGEKDAKFYNVRPKMRTFK